MVPTLSAGVTSAGTTIWVTVAAAASSPKAAVQNKVAPPRAAPNTKLPCIVPSLCPIIAVSYHDRVVVCLDPQSSAS